MVFLQCRTQQLALQVNLHHNILLMPHHFHLKFHPQTLTALLTLHQDIIEPHLQYPTHLKIVHATLHLLLSVVISYQSCWVDLCHLCFYYYL